MTPPSSPSAVDGCTVEVLGSRLLVARWAGPPTKAACEMVRRKLEETSTQVPGKSMAYLALIAPSGIPSKEGRLALESLAKRITELCTSGHFVIEAAAGPIGMLQRTLITGMLTLTRQDKAYAQFHRTVPDALTRISAMLELPSPQILSSAKMRGVIR